MKKVLKIAGIFLLISFAAFYFWPEKTYESYQVDAAYQAQVDAFNLPDMPPDWTWKRFETTDGTKLRWGETGNRDAAKATIIWVPGYTASFEMYGEHTDILAREGYHIIGVDMRGQGGSDRHREAFPEKLWVRNFDVFSNDLAAFIEDLNLTGDRTVILAGISFGGHVVTRAMGDHDLPIHGLFLLTPALKPLSGEYSFDEALRLMKVSRTFGKGKNYVLGERDWHPHGRDFTQGSDCSSNPNRLYNRDVLFTRKPEQRVGGITNQYGITFFESSEYLNEPGYFEKIDVPVTIISAQTDTFVDTDLNRNVCGENFPDCREVTLPKTGHCLLQESDAVLADIFSELDALVTQARGTSGLSQPL